MTKTFTILGSIFALISATYFKLDHTKFGVAIALIALSSFVSALICNIKDGKNKKYPQQKQSNSTKSTEGGGSPMPDETYNVKSENQSGGITAGKIEHVNIITDKESLGIRDQDCIYQNGKKLGTVIGFVAFEHTKTFSIREIQFDSPIRNTATIWQPMEYRGYVLHITKVGTLVTMMPPGATGVSGNILSYKP